MKWYLCLPLLLSACSQSCPAFAVKDWSSDEQRQILAEEQQLPDDSILIPVLEDYARLRIEVRQ
jgi:lipopolysaccharide export system protein LptA